MLRLNSQNSAYDIFIILLGISNFSRIFRRQFFLAFPAPAEDRPPARGGGIPRGIILPKRGDKGFYIF
jgi:hypothetical protein